MADVREGLDSTLTLLEAEFKDRIEVVRQYDSVPPLYCNPGQLNQVFMSLLLNAAQAIAGQGVVTVRTFVDGTEARIQIGDTGRGIAEERMRRIFEPGFSTKGSRVGMAMGLPTSRQIITEHKGRLKLESEPGKGTLVDIALPLPERA